MAVVAQPPRPASSGGSTNRIADFFKVKSGEGTTLALLACIMICIEGGYWLGGNGLDALVFSKFGSDVLAWLLIGKGLLACLAITLYGYWVSRVNRAALLFVTTVVIVVGLVVARLVVAANPPNVVYFLIWTLAYVIPDLLVLQAWGLARQMFDTRQSKRLFPLITAGDTVGIVFGNFLTAPLAGLLGAGNLLLVWALLTALAYLMMRPLRRKIDKTQAQLPRQRRKPERGQGFTSQFKLGYTIIRYYRMMGLLAITTGVSALLYYVLWLPYIKVSTETFPNNPAELAGFFGLVSGLANISAFLLSLFVLNRLFTRYGVRNFVMVTATVNLIGFALILMLNLPFAVVVGFRIVQSVSMQSVTTSAVQTLYNLVPPEARDVATNFNQAVSRQLGIVLAGFMLFLVPTLGPFGITLVLWLAIGLSLVYLLATWRIRNLYRPALVQLLKEGQQDFFNTGETDEVALFGGGSGAEEAISIAVTGLRDPSEGTRRLSAELLGRMGRQEAVAPLIKIVLTDNSPEVRRASIVALSLLNSPDAYPTIAEALADTDPGVRAQAAAALRTSDSGLDPVSLYFLRKALADANPQVRREAVLTMSQFGYQQEALFVLWEMGRDADPAVRAEACVGYSTLGNPSDAMLSREVQYLLRDQDPTVRKQAAAALARFQDQKVTIALIGALEDESPAVNEEAARSLAKQRFESVPLLLRYLSRSQNERGQQGALHALSLCRLAEIEANRAMLLERVQLAEHTTAAADAHATLEETKLELPESLFTEKTERQLMQYGLRQLELARRISDLNRSLSKLDMSANAWKPAPRRPRRNPENLDLLKKSLNHRYTNALTRLIAVVGLLGNLEAIELAGASLRSEDKDAARKRADAIETFENFGDPTLTPGLIELLELEEQGENAMPTKARSLAETLMEVWLENNLWLRACVLHIIGLFSLNKLRALVEETLLVEDGQDKLLAEAALEAQQRLDFPRDDQLLEQLMLEKDMQTLGTLSTMSRILFLQKVAIFSSLSPEDLRRVAIVSKERLYSPGEIICYEGDPGDELYIIVSGKVQVIAGYGAANPSGQASSTGRTLFVAAEGDVLGEMAILEDIPRSATLRAYNGPVRLLTLGEQEFKRILRERPELAIEIIRLLSRWLRETNRRIQNAPSAIDNATLTPGSN